LPLDAGETPKAPSDPAIIQCLLCPAEYIATSGYVSHLREKHGVEKPAVLYGKICPVCAKESTRLGEHVHQSHAEQGLENTSQAFVWARDNGDPHGVVKARLQLLK
jgi:hypothetical protein